MRITESQLRKVIKGVLKEYVGQFSSQVDTTPSQWKLIDAGRQYIKQNFSTRSDRRGFTYYTKKDGSPMTPEEMKLLRPWWDHMGVSEPGKQDPSTFVTHDPSRNIESGSYWN
jgi:hypothetical protein